jgi:hypothetical protein
VRGWDPGYWRRMHWREWQAWFLDAIREAEENDPDAPDWRRALNVNDGKPPPLPAAVRDRLPTLDE